MGEPVLARRGLLRAGLWGGAVGMLPIASACAASGAATSGPAEPETTPPPFPALASAGLTPHQRRMVAVLRAEYAAQPEGTKYSQGVEENWCADFVSWVLREAGTPLRNPNSGGWRIPGTMTLLDTFRASGVWHPAGSEAVPVLGDVVIYDENGPFGQHTNVVLALHGNRLTTIGGNEPARHVTISTHQRDATLGMLGFAHLGCSRPFLPQVAPRRALA